MTTTVKSVGVKKGDLVEVIAGREKGKSGKVLSVSLKDLRVTVEKVNMVKRHVKASAKYPQGGVIEKELGLHVSNVQIMCPKCNRGVRHGVSWVESKTGKKKVRVCKRCNQKLDAAA